VNTEKTVLDLRGEHPHVRTWVSNGTRGDWKVAVTNPEHSHVVCKVKLVMSACRLYWGGGFTLAIPRRGVFLLMQQCNISVSSQHSARVDSGVLSMVDS